MKAQAVAQAMVRGLKRVSPHLEVSMYPMASGGSGTTDLAVRVAGGRVRHETILPSGRRPRDVKWAMLPDGTAIFDARDAMGNPDGPTQLNKAYTNSQPLGEMLKRLIERRPRRIVVALGDVLAADGGMSLLQSFGVTARNEYGDILTSGARSLLHLHHVDFSDLTPPAVPILALTDEDYSWNQRVQQPDFRLDLIHGGLTTASSRYVDFLGEHIRMPLADLSGSGVGGGLGMALAFLGAGFEPGAQYLGKLGALADLMQDVDWVVTGSSNLGDESEHQAVGTVAHLAREAGLSAVALTLSLNPGHLDLYDAGLSGIYPVLDRPRSSRDAHRALPSLIEKAAFRTGYWMQAMSEI